MASTDLKDAFYFVLVTEHYQKYLRFFANEYLKAFVCYFLTNFSPNDSPSKTMKDVFYFI